MSCRARRYATSGPRISTKQRIFMHIVACSAFFKGVGRPSGRAGQRARLPIQEGGALTPGGRGTSKSRNCKISGLPATGGRRAPHPLSPARKQNMLSTTSFQR